MSDEIVFNIKRSLNYGAEQLLLLEDSLKLISNENLRLRAELNRRRTDSPALRRGVSLFDLSDELRNRSSSPALRTSSAAADVVNRRDSAMSTASGFRSLTSTIQAAAGIHVHGNRRETGSRRQSIVQQLDRGYQGCDTRYAAADNYLNQFSKQNDVVEVIDGPENERIDDKSFLFTQNESPIETIDDDELEKWRWK